MTDRLGHSRRLHLGAVVLAAMLALTGCGDDGGDPGPEAAGDGAAGGTEEVVIEGFAFMPDAVEVAAGTTVTWTNQDSAAHTIEDEGGLFAESEDIPQGESFSFTYDTPGDYPYLCGIHPFMTGTVTVSS